VSDPQRDQRYSPGGSSQSPSAHPATFAALKYLAGYLTERKPTLVDVAQVAALLAERSLIMRGL
jgi:hypothetical protein